MLCLLCELSTINRDHKDSIIRLAREISKSTGENTANKRTLIEFRVGC